MQRRIIAQANVADRDLGSVIEDVRSAINRRVQLPQGYFLQYGGQFESQEKASQQIALLSIVAIRRYLSVALYRAEVGALRQDRFPNPRRYCRLQLAQFEGQDWDKGFSLLTDDTNTRIQSPVSDWAVFQGGIRTGHELVGFLNNVGIREQMGSASPH